MSEVTVTSEENFRNTVTYGDRKSFVIDEPVEVGGEDAGPDPYTLLLAALGGCTSMTVSMYARRKGWPLERVRVRLVQERVHAEDCAACATEGNAFVHQIGLSLELDGDLSEQQRARLLEIAQKCPVKKTLTSEIVVKFGEAA